MAAPELRNRQPGMMTLISLAITVAFVYSIATLWIDPMAGFFWEMALLIDVMLLGHWLEMRSVRQASGALNELAKLMPDEAERLNAECFWVVLTPQHAIQIEQLRRLGNTAAALSLLERLAINMGRITPPAPTLRVWIPDCVTVPDNRDMEWNN